MVKFNRHHVTDGTIKARCFYSLDNRIDGRKVVTLYGKDYDGALGKIIPDASTNDSDYQTDYVMTDTVRIFEDHPLYAAARKRAETLHWKARLAA